MSKYKKSAKSLSNSFLRNFKIDDFFLIALSSCFIVISFFVMVLSYSVGSKEEVVLSYSTEVVNKYSEDRVFELRPVLKGGVFSFPVVSAQSVVILDLDSGISLYEKNPNYSLLPASLTKLVAAMVAFEAFPHDQVITFSGRNVEGQKMGLVRGESLTVEDAVKALLIYSANDAAYLLAENYPGGVLAFVSAMNEKAFSLGAVSTHFENPTGFDGGNHKTTAWDLIKISKAVLENKEIMEIVGKKEINVVGLGTGRQYLLHNTNKLLDEVDGVLGIKTGWTENARENLITYYNKDGKRILIVLLGSQDRFGETKELLEWVMESYDWLWVEVK